MVVEAAAKINLTLEVYGKRPDGYHDLRSVVSPISLCDTLEFELTDGEISSDTGYGERDLIVRAAHALKAAGGVKCGARVRVTKRIPAGGGLGGGSADAAATLRTLNSLWHCGFSLERLGQIGATVGSDVPALVLAQETGDAVLMEGRGERVSPFPLGRRFDVVLVFPGVASSTAEVYARCAGRTADDPSVLENFRAALASGDLAALSRAMVNDLQEPAIECYPEIGVALEKLKATGAMAVAMSGSGSTLFAIVSDNETNPIANVTRCFRTPILVTHEGTGPSNR